jgi:hypothetical protein
LSAAHWSSLQILANALLESANGLCVAMYRALESEATCVCLFPLGNACHQRLLGKFKLHGSEGIPSLMGLIKCVEWLKGRR